MRVARSLSTVALAALAILAPASFAAEKTPTPDELRFFESKVRPVLASNCYKCHGPEKQNGKLRLDGIATVLAGGESGKAVVPGKPAASLLVEAINYESFEMPPDGQLKPDEIAALTEWIKMGAPWPPGETPAAAKHGREPGVITDEDRAFWSFQPLAQASPPSVEDNGWSRNQIDRFLVARLRAEGLAPAKESIFVSNTSHDATLADLAAKPAFDTRRQPSIVALFAPAGAGQRGPSR